ncbi:putative endonuclease [Burkholderia multivorans]
MSWYLYLIECADGSVYTGITTDVAARFDEHAAGKGARYTRSRKPRAVLASFPLADRSSASRAEYWVKRLTPAQKRELAAGVRTLESVLPAIPVVVDADIDADEAGEHTDAAACLAEPPSAAEPARPRRPARRRAARASGSPAPARITARAKQNRAAS